MNRKLGAASAWMFASTMVLNLAMVVYHRSMSSRLGNAYADLSALTALGNVLSVINVGVGTWLAKVFATDDSHGGPGAAKARLRALAGPFIGVVCGVSLLLLPLAPMIGAYLHTPAGVFGWVLAGFAGGMVAVLLRSAVQGMHRFGWLGSSLALDGVSRVGIAGGLVSAGWGVNGALASQFFAQTLGSAIAWAGIAKVPATHTQGTPQKPRLLDMGLDTAALALFSLLCFLDVMVVKHAQGDEVAALYSRAALVAKSFLYLAAALNIVLLPAVASARAAGKDARPILGRLLAAALGLDLLGLAGVWYLTGWVIQLLCGPDPAFQALIPLVRDLSLAVIPVALLQMVVIYHLAMGSRLPLALLAFGVPMLWQWLEAAHGAPTEVPLRLGSVSLVLLVVCLADAWRKPA